MVAGPPVKGSVPIWKTSKGSVCSTSSMVGRCYSGRDLRLTNQMLTAGWVALVVLQIVEEVLDVGAEVVDRTRRDEAVHPH